MSAALTISDGLEVYITQASEAVLKKPTQITVFAIAEYLDLVTAREIKSDFKLTRVCNQIVAEYVQQNMENPGFVSFWERSICLFKAYKRALKAAEKRYVQAELTESV